MESACRIYRPRDPRKTALWGLLDTLYERVKGSWEERFERKYGYWRGLADEAVARYLDCGVWANGFARVRCGAEMRVMGFITEPKVITRILDHIRKRDRVGRPPPHPQPAVAHIA